MIQTKYNEALERLPVKVIKAKVFRSQEYKDVLVDGDYDGEYLDSLNWYIAPSGLVDTWYFNRGTGQKYTKRTYLHNFVLPKKKGYWVVHLNGNKLDNRSCNLAYMTPKQAIGLRDERWGGTLSQRAVRQRLNGLKRGGLSMTPFIGVHHEYKKRNGGIKYYGFSAHFRGKYHGTFTVADEAARKYDQLAKECYGDKAVLNFPEDSV